MPRTRLAEYTDGMDDRQFTSRVAANVALKRYSTMRLGGIAKYAVSITERSQAAEAAKWASKRGLPVIVVGSGSNIVWRDEGFEGLLIVNKIQRFEVYEEDELNTYVTIGGGENWDSVVQRCTAAGLSGIEALSLIPGTAGATPVQNVGAYGQEIAQTLVSIEAYDTLEQIYTTIPGAECDFKYRSSRFKTKDRHRFIITALTLHLTRSSIQPPYYGALQAYFDEHAITDRSPATVRQAIIAIRSAKLPDPKQVANNGSFFANPVVDRQTFVQIQADYEAVPHWPASNDTQKDAVKLSAAWLIEQAGFKGVHDESTGMATWKTQPLVLVNEHAQTTADLLTFRQKILDTVRTKFDVQLEQEPELLPATPDHSAVDSARQTQ